MRRLGKPRLDTVRPGERPHHRRPSAKMNEVEGCVSRLRQSHSQGQWCPSLSWESELECLPHAVDMKGGPVHELEKQQLLLPEIQKEKIICY